MSSVRPELPETHGVEGSQSEQTGYSLSRFTPEAQKKIKDQQDLQCSRKECNDKFGRHVLKQSMKLQCQHSMCRECIDIVKARPIMEQLCDSCQEVYRKEIGSYGNFARGSLDTLMGGNTVAAMNNTALTGSASPQRKSSSSVAPAVSTVRPSYFDATSQVVSAEPGDTNQLPKPVDVTKAWPDEQTDMLISDLLAVKLKSEDTGNPQPSQPYNPEYVAQAKKTLGTFVGIRLQNERKTATQLIDAGFQVKRVGDRIHLQCADCLLEIREFPTDSEANPRSYHRSKSPNCPYFGRILRAQRPVTVRRENVGEEAYESYLRRLEEEELIEYICDLRIVKDDSSMNDERNRLQTFPSQKNELCKMLAKFGCHLVSDGQTLKCAFCGFQTEVGVTEMKLDFETVFNNHVKQNCPFLKGINRDSQNIPDLKTWSRDPKNLAAIYNTARLSPSQRIGSFPDMSDIDKRLRSFDRESFSSEVKEMLSEAGYFFQSSVGRIMCFSCGFELMPNSIAGEESICIWEVHARLAPRCHHVLSEVGRAFVNQTATSCSSEDILVQTKYVDLSDLGEPVFPQISLPVQK